MNELLERYIKPYVFVNYDTKHGDVYYCECGEITKLKDTEDERESKDEIKQDLKNTEKSLVSMSQDEDFQEEFKYLYKGMKLGMEDEICCPSCQKNFKESHKNEMLISHGSPFISNFSYEENESTLTLNYTVLSPNLNSVEKRDFFEKTRYLRLNKLTKNLYYKSYDEPEVEFDLDEVVKYTNLFFVFDTLKVVNIMEMHIFIGRLANFIMDSKNIDIIKELLETLRGNVGHAGLDVIKKITSMFLGIIKYSNLSTIAMTKGPVFLYDLMHECDIPKPSVLIENNVTSPIKIFNFLVQNHINKINIEVNEDNKKAHDFTFKSKTRINYDNNGDNVNVEDLAEEKEITIKINTGESQGKVKIDKGIYQIEEAVTDGSVSKFIFNKIQRFNDYRKVIKFLKLVNKQELIQLLQKYDIDFLVNVIDMIYFRNQVPFKELEKILDIILDFVAVNSKKHCDVMDGIVRMNYAHVKHFSFINYDDALMMMEVLQFDPKVHFNKIRTFDELNLYHDYLIKYFSVLKDEEKNGGIMQFTSQFKMLEKNTEDDSPIEFRILSTPGMIIKEGVEMRHSASAYARNVAQGRYLMGQIYDKDPNRTELEPARFTIGFTYNKLTGLEFEQVKGFANETGEGIPKKTDRFKRLMMDWLTNKDISFRPIGDLKLTEEVGNDGTIN
jgi:hypothetical protein